MRAAGSWCNFLPNTWLSWTISQLHYIRYHQPISLQTRPVTNGGSFCRLVWCFRPNNSYAVETSRCPKGFFAQRYHIKSCYGGKSQPANEERTLSLCSTDFILALFLTTPTEISAMFSDQHLWKEEPNDSLGNLDPKLIKLASLFVRTQNPIYFAFCTWVY